MHGILKILVPNLGSQAHKRIVPGSAVVSNMVPREGMIHVYFEGAIYHYGGSKPTYLDKLMTASGRLMERYPTVAMGYHVATDFTVVGTYDGIRNIVMEISDEEALQKWSPFDKADLIGEEIPEGEKDWTEIQRIAERGRMVSSANGNLWFQTLSGQLVQFAFAKAPRRVHVYRYDDPALPGIMKSQAVSDQVINWTTRRNHPLKEAAEAGMPALR